MIRDDRLNKQNRFAVVDGLKMLAYRLSTNCYALQYNLGFLKCERISLNRIRIVGPINNQLITQTRQGMNRKRP